MKRSVEERVLNDIDKLLTNLNEKLGKMIMIQLWLSEFKSEIEEIKEKNTLVI